MKIAKGGNELPLLPATEDKHVIVDLGKAVSEGTATLREFPWQDSSVKQHWRYMAILIKKEYCG